MQCVCVCHCFADSSLPVKRKSERTSVTDKKLTDPLLSEIGKVSDAPPQIRRSPRNSENDSPIRNGRDALNASNRKSPRNDPRSKNTLSPVTPCAGRAGAPPNEDPRDQPNLIWSKKVRRSYSRLSDGSFDGTPSGSPLPPRPDRLSLFGFGGLCGVSPNSENDSPIRNGRDALNASNRKSPRNDPRSKNTLSPVTPCAGRAGAPPNEDPRDQPNLIWSKKVRRSYSRLSEGSVDGTPSGSPLPPRTDRLSLFGFGGLCGVSPVRGGGGRSLLEGAGAGVAETSPPAAEQDFDIPGVALVKKRRRKKKVQQIQMSELDCLAAQMNAEFDAAEEFDLCVE
ncbi:UNVERIFIED_CONTAM: hypothetical protein FKN15_003816 [Acipenser sinensis]